MGKLYVKNYQIVLFISLLLIGILFLALLSEPVKYIGILLIVTDVLYAGNIIYTSISKENNHQLRSRTRDQILRFQHKR
ncbi:MAG: hypothetical protein WAO52_15115 [Prolixibacteraceae bacterium]